MPIEFSVMTCLLLVRSELRVSAMPPCSICRLFESVLRVFKFEFEQYANLTRLPVLIAVSMPLCLLEWVF